ATAVHRREQDVLRDLPAAIRDLPTDVLELKSDNMVGIDALGGLLVSGPGTGADTGGTLGEAPVVFADSGGDRLEALVDELAEQDHGLVMLMGKGGVGKTTVAAAIAVALAGRGLPVHLTTTDPAAHLDETLDGGLENLTVSRI